MYWCVFVYMENICIRTVYLLHAMWLAIHPYGQEPLQGKCTTDGQEPRNIPSCVDYTVAESASSPSPSEPCECEIDNTDGFFRCCNISRGVSVPARITTRRRHGFDAVRGCCCCCLMAADGCCGGGCGGGSGCWAAV